MAGLHQYLAQKTLEQRRDNANLFNDSRGDVGVLNALQAQISELKAKVSQLEDNKLKEAAHYNGDMLLVLERSKDPGETITAAALNAAAAGTEKLLVKCTMESAGEHVHEWLDALEPVLTAGNTVADGDVSSPTITGTPQFKAGQLEVELTFDTDAGATKTYLAAETLTLQIQVKADDELLGWAVADVTKTITVV